jgi:hypothetical protein
MFAFSNQNAVHLVLAPGCRRWWIATILFSVIALTSLLPLLFERQVQVQWQDIWVLLLKVFTTSHLGIVELLQVFDVILRQWLVKGAQESSRIF